MLKVNSVYEFDIVDMGINFEGIAKIDDGLTVFIPGALKGEKVKAKVIKITNSFAVATISEIITKSKYREISNCKYYDKCGGCMARHTTYENTLDIKLENLKNTLKKQDIDISKINSIYGMSNPYYYRNKVQYPVREIDNETKMGMFEKDSHIIVENDYCFIQDEIIHIVAKDLFDLVKQTKLKGYNEETKTGDVKNIMVRRGTHTGEIMCVLVINNKELVYGDEIKYIVNKITEKYNEIKSIILNINTKDTNVILSNENVCAFGKDYITDIIGDYVFKITADSFFQVNTIQAELLYNLLKENFNLDKDKTLLELYSGVGSIGIFLSSFVKEIYSVEIVESAVIAAKENARINNITNVINIVGDATKETLKLVNDGKYFNYIVVDPPRKGLDIEGIELILKLKPEKIGYVSCNPATLARDLKLLSDTYDIVSINAVDMFPWTSHIETIVILNLK